MSTLEAEYVDWIENKIAEMEDALDELDKLDPDYHTQYKEIADNCTKEIAGDMIYNAGMNERKYLYHFRDYEQALCTEVTELINTGNLWEILNGIWQNKD